MKVDEIMSICDLINELIDVSYEKKNIMKNILETVKLERKFIELQNIEAISRQNDLKLKYMIEIEKLDMKFYSSYNKLKANLSIDSIEKINIEKYPQVKKLKEVVRDILILTQEIKIADNQNILKLKGDKDNSVMKLKYVRQCKNVINAYRVYNNQVRSVFFDKKK